MSDDSSGQAGAGSSSPKKPFSRHFPAIARYLLGLPLLVFGLNAFLDFIPQPTTPLPADAAAFVGALMKSGYMMKLIGATHLAVAISLLSNRFVPLGLALFAPFIVNAIAFHASIERSGLPMAAVFLALEVYLAWKYRHSFGPMLAARASPS
jgi:putative oxidoreductase